MTEKEGRSDHMDVSDQAEGSLHHSEVDHAETALEASVCQAQERIAASRRNRNALVPFHSLPTELVGNIFYLSFSKSYASTITLEGLRNLASVSYAWWQIVKTHPQLWTFINLSQSETVQLMLRRSGSLPVSIYWHEGRRSDGVWPPLLEAIKLVCTHTHRWKSLDVYSRQMEMWDEALRLPLPLLESLALDVQRGRTLDFTTFVGGPRLSKLKLTNIIPPVDIQPFVNLETLHLDAIPALLPVDYLLSILHAAGRLEELRLTNINTTSMEAEDPQRLEEPIVLTALWSLAPINCSSSTVVALLLSISCPGLQSLTVSYDGTENEADVRTVLWHLFHTPMGLSLWTTVSHRRAQYENLSERIVISFDYGTTLQIHGGGFSVTIAGHDSAPLLPVLSGLPAFPFHHLASTPIHLDFGDPSESYPVDPEECLLLLGMLPAVTSVTLFGDYDLTLQVIARLDHSQETQNGTEWSLPRLEALKVYCLVTGSRQVRFMRAVRTMVQARRASLGDGLVGLAVEIRGEGEVMIGMEDGT